MYQKNRVVIPSSLKIRQRPAKADDLAPMGTALEESLDQAMP
jgi:hypothetical protein